VKDSTSPRQTTAITRPGAAFPDRAGHLTGQFPR